MATRATITVSDSYDTFHIYHHLDSNPAYMVSKIREAQEIAWSLPRFEADDFGAAIICATKTSAGGVYLADSAESHWDVDYHYHITQAEDKAIRLRIFSQANEVLYDGTLDAAVHSDLEI